MIFPLIEKLTNLIKAACGGYMVYTGAQIYNLYPDLLVEIPGGLGLAMIGLFIMNMRFS